MTVDKVESNTGKSAETIEVRWLNSLADIDAAAGPWRALDQRSTAELVWFQSYEWCRNWVEHHLGPTAKPKILMLLSGEEARAVLPMVIRRAAGGIKMLSILGEPHTQYANMLTENGKLDHSEIEIIRKALATATGADAAVFQCVDCNSPLASVLGETTAKSSLANEAAQLELDTVRGSGFEERMGKNKQRDHRRRLRVLSTDGELKLDVLRPGMANYREAIDTLISMKRDWLDATGKIGSGLMYQGHGRFLNSLAQMPDAQDGPYVFAMKTGSKTLAVELGFLQKGHYYAYMGGFDWSLRKHSPGKVQMCMTINALADMGAKSYDLLANPTDYKKDYSDTQRQLSGHVVTLTKRGAIYTNLWTQGLLPLARRAFYGLPDRLRQAITGLRQIGVLRGV